LTTPSPRSQSGRAAAPAFKVVAAFAAVYVIWGSTYLTIKWAVETIPPFLMAGTRFLIAGSCMYAWARLKGAERPTAAHWRSTGIVGAFLLLGGNGCVVWASQRMPSGVSSLFIATTPLWMVGLDWMRRDGKRPSFQVLAGLALGFVGLVFLVQQKTQPGTQGVDPWGAASLILGTICWASGSIYSRSARLPGSSILAVGMEQLMGGAMLAIVGLVAGETARFHITEVTARSGLSFLYLMTIGSFVAFTAYIWLLQVTSAAKVSTYAYVNPVVAVFLGWALNGEHLSHETMVATLVIVSAVVVITLDRIREAGKSAAPEARTAAPAEAERR
jgi:drug/metabolite transporter (DMT)-like permease